MSRRVTHEATGPLKLDRSDLDEQNGDVAICLCGLSEEFPFCDGTHRTTRDEPDDAVFEYDDGDRRAIERIVYEDGSEREVGSD